MTVGGKISQFPPPVNPSAKKPIAEMMDCFMVFLVIFRLVLDEIFPPKAVRLWRKNCLLKKGLSLEGFLSKEVL